MEKPFNPNEPVQTRDGRKARIICTDRIGENPIIALIGDSEFLWSYPSDGRLRTAREYENLDLINVPRRIKGWVNVYGAFDFGAHVYPSKDRADANVHGKRIACIYVDFAEGEGL